MALMESEMFERDKKDDTVDPNTEFRGEASSGTGSQRSRPAAAGRDVAVIGGSIQINGDLRGNEDLRIEGDVSGTVRLENSALTIGKGGKVKAGVYAKSIAVDGETKGDLHATECVSIHANAKVQGNIIAPRVSIVEGAHFKGSIEMDPKEVEKALGTSMPDNKKQADASKKSADAKPAPQQPAANASTASNRQAKSA